MTPDTSGPPSRTPFAYYDRETSCWRTSQGTFLSDWATFSETWPRSGMTHAGSAYALPTWVPRTGDSACSSLLPTPQRVDGHGCVANTGQNPTLAGVFEPERLAEHLARMLPGIVLLFGMPRSVLWKAGDVPTTLAMVARNGYKSRLEEDVALLPTPTVNDMGAGKTPEAWDARTERMRESHGNGNGHGRSLEQGTVRLLPTPRAQNGVERNAHPWARPLDEPQNLENALARVPTVAQQIGASTPPPSPAGKTSSDDQPPPPPNLAATDDPDWLPISWNG